MQTKSHMPSLCKIENKVYDKLYSAIGHGPSESEGALKPMYTAANNLPSPFQH